MLSILIPDDCHLNAFVGEFASRSSWQEAAV